MKKFRWQLMTNNILDEDKKALLNFIKSTNKFTSGIKVKEFEKKWSKWLGVNHSVFVNSGSSANFLTMAALKILYGKGDIIVPTLTWVSEINSVIQNNDGDISSLFKVLEEFIIK